MVREQVTTAPRRQARGGHVACTPAAELVSDLSTEVQTPARDNHRGQGMGHLPVYTVTGVPRPSARNAARPHVQRCTRAERSADPRKLLARPPQSQPRGLGRRLSCNGVDMLVREHVTTAPRRQARGDMLPAHQLQGELAISVPRYRQPRATITAGKGYSLIIRATWNFCLLALKDLFCTFKLIGKPLVCRGLSLVLQ